MHALRQADPGCDVTRCVTVCTHFTRNLYQVREACHVVLISRLWARVLDHASNMPTSSPTVPARARKFTIPGQGSTLAASLCPGKWPRGQWWWTPRFSAVVSRAMSASVPLAWKMCVCKTNRCVCVCPFMLCLHTHIYTRTYAHRLFGLGWQRHVWAVFGEDLGFVHKRTAITCKRRRIRVRPRMIKQLSRDTSAVLVQRLIPIESAGSAAEFGESLCCAVRGCGCVAKLHDVLSYWMSSARLVLRFASAGRHRGLMGRPPRSRPSRVTPGTPLGSRPDPPTHPGSKAAV